MLLLRFFVLSVPSPFSLYELTCCQRKFKKVPEKDSRKCLKKIAGNRAGTALTGTGVIL